MGQDKLWTRKNVGQDKNRTETKLRTRIDVGQDKDKHGTGQG